MAISRPISARNIAKQYGRCLTRVQYERSAAPPLPHNANNPVAALRAPRACRTRTRCCRARQQPLSAPVAGSRFGYVSYIRARAVNPARPRPRFRAERLLAAKKRKKKEKGKRGRRRREEDGAGSNSPVRCCFSCGLFLVRLPARKSAAVLCYPRAAQ